MNEQMLVLKEELHKILNDWFVGYTSEPIPSVGFGSKSYKDVKDQVFDALVDTFMREKFGEEWKENDEAQGFYENTACDLRGGAENDMQEWIDNFGEFTEKVLISHISREEFTNYHLIKVEYMTHGGEECEIYFNLDGTGTDDSDVRLHNIVKSCFLKKDQEQFDKEVKLAVNEKVLGFDPTDEDGESIFGCNVNNYGVYKYCAEDGRIAVVAHEYMNSYSYEDKSKHFANEAEFNAWEEEMNGEYFYGDARITIRAINDIE